MEQRLAELNRELEARVASRTRELEMANRDLASSRRRSRTTCAPRCGRSAASRRSSSRSTRDQVPDEAQHYLDLVARGATEMSQLIDDLLTFARTGRQDLERRTVDRRRSSPRRSPTLGRRADRGRRARDRAGPPGLLRRPAAAAHRAPEPPRQRAEVHPRRGGAAGRGRLDARRRRRGRRTGCATTASASTRRRRTACSRCSSGCTRPTSSRGPGWDWRSSSASSTGTAAACGGRRAGEGATISLRARRRGRPVGAAAASRDWAAARGVSWRRHPRPGAQRVQEMVIYGVSFDMVGKQPIVLLKTVDGNKFLPIWIGHPEAAAILMKLQGASTPRPMTHDLLVDMLGELDAKCTQVAVTELRDNTFFASITLSVDGTRDRDRLAPERRARARGPRRRADLRRRGGDRRVGDRVRARGRGHRGGRREVQGVPRRGLAGGLRRGDS